MKPKKDPIKPSKLLMKKPNFKKEKLDDELIKVVVPHSLVIPGVYTREVDTSTIQIGELDHSDIEYFTRGMLFGGPIGVSSRSVQHSDGRMEFLGYDLVASPSTPSSILGGEHMAYNASTWMTLNKKKTRWERLKEWVSNIYKKWKLAE